MLQNKIIATFEIDSFWTFPTLVSFCSTQLVEMRRVVPRVPSSKSTKGCRTLKHSTVTDSTTCRHETLALIVYWHDAPVDFSFSFGHFEPFFRSFLCAESQAESTYVEATWFRDEIGCTIAILQVCDGQSMSILKSSALLAASSTLQELLAFSHKISLNLPDRMV